MKRIIFSLVLIMGLQAATNAQSTNDFMIGFGLDFLKTDFNAVGDKVQLGAELNYFLRNNFSVTGGFEFWSQDRNSLIIGMRWYPIDNAFVRFRGLLGENDLALGFGWSKALDRNFRFEAMGDYYTTGDFAVRAGIAFVIR
jgi:hypothetical protein